MNIGYYLEEWYNARIADDYEGMKAATHSIENCIEDMVDDRIKLIMNSLAE